MPTLGVGSFSEAHADLNVESDLLVLFDRTRKREREREREHTYKKKERKKKKRSTGKRNEERTCTPRLETAPPSPLFSPKARSTLRSRTEIHTSRTSRARPCVTEERERERENKICTSNARKKEKKNILHPHSLLKGRALLRFEFETKTKRKQKKFSHASVIALAEALSPLFAKSSIIFVYVLCVFLFSLSFLFLFFLCVFFARSKKIFLSSLLSFVVFFCVGLTEFLYEKIFEIQNKRKKGLPKLSKNKRTRSL
jgi:hypothetical protein